MKAEWTERERLKIAWVVDWSYRNIERAYDESKSIGEHLDDALCEIREAKRRWKEEEEMLAEFDRKRREKENSRE